MKNKNLMDFIDKTPNAYYCVKNLKEELIAKGYKELYEYDNWNKLKGNGKYFVIRNDSSLIAFKTIDNEKEKIGFNIVSAHADSPSFSIKPNALMYDGNYLKLNTSPYGDMLNYTWFDRPLSLAGRVIVRKDGANGSVFNKHLINIDKDLLIIPSQAIHINREVNENASFNHQIDMLPVISLNHDKLNCIISDQLNLKNNEWICDYDLYLYNRDKAKFVGFNNDMISAPRLDDLGSLYPAFVSFLKSNNNKSIDVFCAFNNEEIGSLTGQGADSTFLIDTLTRIADASSLNLLTALNNSIVVSADNAHANHPNASSKTDPTNNVLLNKGVVIKHHINYTTDAATSSIFKQICIYANAPYQDYACRSDMRCGFTLGGISQSHVSIDSIDIGLPQLAMHSANETIGSEDPYHMYRSLLSFYNAKFTKEKDKILVYRGK